MGVRLPPSAFLLPYLLAAAEFGFAALSWLARSITDARAIRVVVVTLAVFHASSGLFETYAHLRGLVGAAVLGNVAARALIVALLVRLAPRAR